MRHKDSPLVLGSKPQRQQAAVPYALRVPAQARTSVQDESGRWKPKQPALFSATEVLDCPEAVFGRLPKGFLTRMALPRLMVSRQDLLHVCSGSLREKWTVDLRREVLPRIVADGCSLPFRDGAFRAVLLDPPYVPAWARQYGTKYPPTYPLLREAARVVAAGGRIGLLHFLVPFPPKGTRRIHLVGISVAPGYQMRAFTVFQRDSEQPAAQRPSSSPLPSALPPKGLG